MNYSIFDKYLLKDLIVNVVDNRGKTPLTSPVKTDEFCIPLIEINSLSSTNKFPDIARVKKYVNKNTYETWFRSGHPQHGDILVPTVGTIGLVSMMNSKVACIAQNLIGLRFDKNIVTQEYAFYYMRSTTFTKQLFNLDIGGVQPSIKVPHLLNSEIIVPQLSTQKHITEILSSLDNKIELNNKINKNLEELAQTLYKRWFEDFEFPNEDGEPYKSSGGEMVESELGLIPKGWSVKKQAEYFPVVTGKKNANVATTDGKFKFFTCSQEIYLTDNYSFEGDAILVAGNGDFNVKYYSGKFEAYQRTYVLIPSNSKLSGVLYFAIKHNLNDITSGSRGSVISFITKGNLENFKIAFPNIKTLEQYGNVFKNILINIAHYNEQNEKLSNMRDELLPKLMNGEIEVPIEE